MSIFSKSNKEEHPYKLEFSSDFSLQKAWDIYDETDECILVVKRKALKVHPTLEIYDCRKKAVVATIKDISNQILRLNETYEIEVEGEPFDIIRYQIKQSRYISDKTGLEMELKILSQVFHLNGQVVAETKVRKFNKVIYFDNKKLKMYLLLIFFCYVLHENVDYQRVERESRHMHG